MSRTFTKLFSSITESTVWCASASTRLVWITMLAMADRKGRIWASVPGLANRARVSVEETETALGSFLSPDPHSRTTDYEGRRIEEIDGGWRLLNYSKYREYRDEEDRREYQRDWDRKNRCNPTKSDKSDPNRPPTTKAEAEAEIEALRSKQRAGRSQGSRLPQGWRPSEPLTAWMRRKRPDLNVEETVEKFVDHWAAQPGRHGVKLDWEATFRNWVRNEKRDPLPAPAPSGSKLCGYCDKRSVGKVNNIEYCSDHSLDAMDQKPQPKAVAK
jgi:hypothetical protein